MVQEKLPALDGGLTVTEIVEVAFLANGPPVIDPVLFTPLTRHQVWLVCTRYSKLLPAAPVFVINRLLAVGVAAPETPVKARVVVLRVMVGGAAETMVKLFMALVEAQ
jgi:hypothetical protein